MNVIVIHYYNADSMHSTAQFMTVAKDYAAAVKWIQKQIDDRKVYAKTVADAIGREYHLQEITIFE